MSNFRAYIIDAEGHIKLRVDLEVPNESAAKDKARQLVDGHAVELWDGAKKLDRFEPTRRR
ncbi:hypothetical protein CO683_40330 [Bradyrhizobium ottawaense]|nr:hypothetical protein [Bradyrhizobium sp. CCBAU 11445]PDT64102.1 hypothetical protein CO683_40330 [Bradyrhizobium ottawaense]GMO10799.1 hypothetical protein BwSH12_77020 [Bradyrhizobium ottawaense]GMO10902.1 hypothetical protein BwSH20_76280 [Bradyrhizobium ottawaense]GMO39182.1 hypothetical protein BwSH14_48930 [Bradyrhizobium ottawaense]